MISKALAIVYGNRSNLGSLAGSTEMALWFLLSDDEHPERRKHHDWGYNHQLIRLAFRPLLFGYYLIATAGASGGVMMVLVPNNTPGYTKKATVNSIQIIAPVFDYHPHLDVHTFRQHQREQKARQAAGRESGIDLENPEVQADMERAKFMDLMVFLQIHFRYVK
ncbi:putative mfs allantoate transporter protein [Seiridium unicorne]|uniref:Mfs allantoate transporter protein n=1 Tax=Seiridium unicorne TaxID=138068 RepID=A0ABR2ULZ6_9PEZI